MSAAQPLARNSTRSTSCSGSFASTAGDSASAPIAAGAAARADRRDTALYAIQATASSPAIHSNTPRPLSGGGPAPTLRPAAAPSDGAAGMPSTVRMTGGNGVGRSQYAASSDSENKPSP